MANEPSAATDLDAVASACEEAGAVFDRDPLDSLIRRAREAARSLAPSWSQSWAGYHARCYWQDFERPEVRFSIEWGISGGPPTRPVAVGRGPRWWREYKVEDVHAEIRRRANLADPGVFVDAASTAGRVFAERKREILTTLDALLASGPDPALREIRDGASALEDHISEDALVRREMPSRVVTRDRRFEYEGVQVPPHIEFEAFVVSAISHGGRLKDLAALARKASLYLAKKDRFRDPPAAPVEAEQRSTSEQPWDLWGIGFFAFGVLVGRFGGGVLVFVHDHAVGLAGSAPPWAKAIVVGLSVGLALAAAGVAGNLVASRIDRDGGIMRAVFRSRRVRLLFLAAVLLSALAQAMSQW